LLTVAGDKMATRVASSLLKAIGLPQLIAADLCAYEERAVQLATDTEALFTLRQQLAAQRHTAPLFDTARWVRSFEGGLQKIHRAHQVRTHLEDCQKKRT
jgi:protein O-GlcNAc transferase